ncbi:MAG: CPBP family glutamic-type intramembrane protease [Fuerstiella sp.]
MNTAPASHESSADTPQKPIVSITWFQQLAFIVKELKETLRDRRTITTLLAMPILVYPLLGMGFRFIALKQTSVESPSYQFVVQTEDETAWLMSALGLSKVDDNTFESVTQQQASQDPSGQVEPEAAAQATAVRFVQTEIESPEAVRQAVADQQADAGIIVSLALGQDPSDFARRSVTIVEASGNAVSRRAAEFLEKQFRILNLQATRSWAKQQDPDFELPLTQERIQIMPDGGTSVLLGFMPLVLLLMTVTGGVYPAIDLTAGERERDTLETLMALPVPAFRLILAKFIAVVFVTFMTGLMNLIAMTITVYVLQLEQTLFGESGITAQLILQLLVVLITFAIFYSSMLLILTSSARSFKEAQAYLIPLLLLSIAPGLVILLPGWKLTLLTAVVPMVNMLLMAKGIFEGSAAALPSLIAISVTLFYSMACLSIAARLFGTDAVTTGSSSSWNDLLLRPKTQQKQPSITTALTTLALLVPGHFVASGLLGRDANVSMTNRMIMSGCLTVSLFLLFPLLIAVWNRLDLKAAFRALPFSIVVGVAAIFVGSSTWPFVFELIAWLQGVGIIGIDPSKMQQAQALLEGWRGLSLPLLIIVLGVLPALCEEAFFRGFLFSGLRKHMSASRTVFVTAIAFGLFHVILAGGAAPERLLPSTLMGLLLGWVSVRTGSLVPGILLHAAHNSLLMTIAHFRDELSGFAVGLQSQQHLPTTWLAIAGAVFVVGIGLLITATAESSINNQTINQDRPTEQT